MDLALYNIIVEIDGQGLIRDSGADEELLLRGLPLLGCCDGRVRWWSPSDASTFNVPEWWNPKFRLQPFAGNAYGDYWCFQPSSEHLSAITLVSHDLNEARCFAPSFELFLFRSILNALAGCDVRWGSWPLLNVKKMMRNSVAVASSLMSTRLSDELDRVIKRRVVSLPETEEAWAKYVWAPPSELNRILSQMSDWSDWDKKFAYHLPPKRQKSGSVIPKLASDLASGIRLLESTLKTTARNWKPEAAPIEVCMTDLGGAVAERANRLTVRDATILFDRVESILVAGSDEDKAAIIDGFLPGVAEVHEESPKSVWILQHAGAETKKYLDEWAPFFGE